jgi:hypothetical protein
MFRRAQAIVAVLALLAAPLALYARGTANAMPDCNGMCCLPHGHHAPQNVPAHHADATPPETDAQCHHASAAAPPSHAETGHACAFQCDMHPNPPSIDYGRVAPLPPTKPSNLVDLLIVFEAHLRAPLSTQSAISCFLDSPFQPPRA